MIFKVFYQEDSSETPVRENTQSIYVEAENEVEVRQILQNQSFHIEYIEKLSNAHLEYEKSQPAFKLWEK